MNELSTKVVKLDFNFILDNFYKPELWGKKWIIFEYDGYKISFEITTINIASKSIYYTLELYRSGNYLAGSGYNSINFSKGNRNLVAIQNGVDGQIIRLIEDYEKKIIMNTEAYELARQYDNDLLDKIELAAIALLDLEGIKNTDIRDAYIESQKDRFDNHHYRAEVISTYQYKKIKYLYMAYSLFSGNRGYTKKFSEITKLNGFKVGEIKKEIKEKLAEIETDDFLDTIELEKIT